LAVLAALVVMVLLMVRRYRQDAVGGELFLEQPDWKESL
jgi:hypothetical protein